MARPSDIGWMVEQLQLFSEEQQTERKTFGRVQYAMEVMENMVMEHFALIAEDDHEPIGFLTAYDIPHPYNPDINILSEQFWWVTPRRRHTSAGMKLLQEYISWGRSNQIDWILLSTQTETRIKDESLEALGFRLKEKSFIMEVTGWQKQQQYLRQQA